MDMKKVKLENIIVITENGTIYEDGGLTLNQVLYEYTKFVDNRDYVRFVYIKNDDGSIGDLMFNNVYNVRFDDDGQVVFE